ncbi:MAG: 5-formyltetrahydrofolate cyclo-ligase [Paracoccus sp. (in: a-proteobacteria)]|nr:5-formyltetrahydrofolate cyclo-ligase [Paracoccus sp. (in: a-proteobacteria)]
MRQDLAARRASACAALGAGAPAAMLARALSGRGGVLSFYWPMGDEADPRGALSGWSDPLCLPVVAGRAQPLRFRRWRAGDDLAQGAFGTSHPLPDAPELVPQVLIVPLLGADTGGNRLGYGGGFYDRTLADLRANGPVTAIGFCFDAQIVAQIPTEATDQRLDIIVTERRIITP